MSISQFRLTLRQTREQFSVNPFTSTLEFVEKLMMTYLIRTHRRTVTW